MRALHEDHHRQQSATAIHFDEKSTASEKRIVIFSAKNAKILFLLFIWLTTTVIFIVHPENHLKYYYSHVPPEMGKYFRIKQTLDNTRLDVYLKGAFSEVTTAKTLTLYAIDRTERVSDSINFSLVEEKDFETSKSITVSTIMTLPDELLKNNQTKLHLFLTTNCNITFSLALAYDLKPLSVEAGIGFGAAVLVLLYVLIISEIIDRTFAALLTSSLAIAALALFNERPNLEEIISWIDMDTLMLLFGMMILVAITSETGFFDYMAVFVFKKTKGKVWPLICSLSLVSMVSALFLDSVSTVLLMTPVVIRISEVTNLNPVPVLTIMILAVNIGSIASPVGNPPNVMIINNSFIKQAGVGFLQFISHTLPGVIVLTVQSYLHIRYLTFRNIRSLRNADSIEVANIKHELKMWKNTDRSISAISKFDDISRSVIHSRVILLNEALQREMESSHRLSTEALEHPPLTKNISFYLMDKKGFESKTEVENVDKVDKVRKVHKVKKLDKHEQLTRRLEEMYPIKNKLLLKQCGVAFFVVMLFFFLHALPYFENISLGWASLLGVCLLLIISNNNDDFKSCLMMVEWSSLLFFATLFVLMESLTKIGLIKFIGEQLSELVKLVPVKDRLLVAIVLVLWVSTFISAFLDNIPLTSMMTKVIITLSTSLNLPISPMVWALAFACGIGGNGTLIASSSNLVCIGVAEQHGYKFSFIKFMKVGFPLLLTNGVVITLYLYIFHVLIEWF